MSRRRKAHHRQLIILKGYLIEIHHYSCPLVCGNSMTDENARMLPTKPLAGVWCSVLTPVLAWGVKPTLCNRKMGSGCAKIIRCLIINIHGRLVLWVLSWVLRGFFAFSSSIARNNEEEKVGWAFARSRRWRGKNSYRGLPQHINISAMPFSVVAHPLISRQMAAWSRRGQPVRALKSQILSRRWHWPGIANHSWPCLHVSNAL